MSESNKPIIFLMGPTATGKTDHAIEIAQQAPIEIISVDSAMIYKTMNIGTGKPNAETLAKIPHHLINICDPKETYSVADFRRDALNLIERIQQQNKIPFFVGGSMLYFKALRDGISALPTANLAIRKELQEQLQKQGSVKLHEKLQAIDPISAARIHPQDPQRLLRALEVYAISGKTLTQYFAENNADIFPHPIIQIALTVDDRDLLHQIIAKRFLKMLADGFIDEVAALKQRSDLHLELSSMRCVGYRQIWRYLANEINHAEMVDRSIIATRQLAKRQLTWLRSFSNLEIFDFTRKDLIKEILIRLRADTR